MALVVHRGTATPPEPARRRTPPKNFIHSQQHLAQTPEARAQAQARSQALLLFREGMELAQKGNEPAAAELYEKALSWDPACVGALDALDRCRMQNSGGAPLEQVGKGAAEATEAAFEALRKLQAAAKVISLWRPKTSPDVTTEAAAKRFLSLRKESSSATSPRPKRMDCHCGSLAGCISDRRLHRANERSRERLHGSVQGGVSDYFS